MGLAGADELKSDRYASLDSNSLPVLVLADVTLALPPLLGFPSPKGTDSVALPPAGLLSFTLLEEEEADTLLPSLVIFGFFSSGGVSSGEGVVATCVDVEEDLGRDDS